MRREPDFLQDDSAYAPDAAKLRPSRLVLGFLMAAAAVGGVAMVADGPSDRASPAQEEAAIDCSSPRHSWRWTCHGKEHVRAGKPGSAAEPVKTAQGPEPAATGALDSSPGQRASTVKTPESAPTPKGNPEPSAAAKPVPQTAEQKTAEAHLDSAAESAALPPFAPEPPRRPAHQAVTAASPAPVPASAPAPRASNRLADTYRAMIEAEAKPPKSPAAELAEAAPARPAPTRKPAAASPAAEPPVVATERLVPLPPKRVAAAVPVEAEEPIRRRAAPILVEPPAPAPRRSIRTTPAREIVEPVAPAPRRIVRVEPVEPAPPRRIVRADPVEIAAPRSPSSFPPEFLSVLRSHNTRYAHSARREFDW